MVMRKIIGWAPAWIFFGIGHLISISRIMDWWPSEKFHPYALYNRCMTISGDIQDWMGWEGLIWTKTNE